MTKHRPTRANKPPVAWPPAIAAILVLIAIIAVFALGLSLGQQQQNPKSKIQNPKSAATQTPYATIPVGPVPLGATPNPQANLTIRLDIRDAVTGEPVRATIWVGERLVAKDTSLHQFTLTETKTKGAKYAPLKIEAKGYQTWEKFIRFNVEYDRLIPLGVELQRLKPAVIGGSGA